MALTAVWSEESLAHDPEGEVWIGVRIVGDETPERGTVMKSAIDLRAGDPAPVRHPDDHKPDDPHRSR